MGLLSKLLGREDKANAALQNAMEAILRIIDDEQFQNELLPNPLMMAGAAVDRLPNGRGAFGFEAGNPIPVNGPIGELAYLSRLETVQGERLLFHRIGAVGTTDVFEAVTFSGSGWYVFFVDMYHPRRSRLAPDGFRIANEPRQFSGFHNHCAAFPYDFAKAKEAAPDLLRLAYIPLGNVMPQIDRRAFSRPIGHKEG
jgi:hypothetical protein